MVRVDVGFVLAKPAGDDLAPNDQVEGRTAASARELRAKLASVHWWSPYRKNERDAVFLTASRSGRSALGREGCGSRLDLGRVSLGQRRHNDDGLGDALDHEDRGGVRVELRSRGSVPRDERATEPLGLLSGEPRFAVDMSVHDDVEALFHVFVPSTKISSEVRPF